MAKQIVFNIRRPEVIDFGNFAADRRQPKAGQGGHIANQQSECSERKRQKVTPPLGGVTVCAL